MDIVIFQQWRVQCLIYSSMGMVVVVGNCSIYNGYIIFVYYGVNVFKVNVYVIWYGDDFGNIFSGCGQDVICFIEGI